MHLHKDYAPLSLHLPRDQTTLYLCIMHELYTFKNTDVSLKNCIYCISTVQCLSPFIRPLCTGVTLEDFLEKGVSYRIYSGSTFSVLKAEFFCMSVSAALSSTVLLVLEL